jgi:hypothetical protein
MPASITRVYDNTLARDRALGIKGHHGNAHADGVYPVA